MSAPRPPGGRALLLLAAAVVLGGAAAAFLVWRGSGEVPPRPAPAAAPPDPVAGPPAVEPQLAPAAPTDPEVLRRDSERAEARARYRSLRDAFSSGRPAAAARARLEPVLRTLAKAGSAGWKWACRGLTCRVDAAGDAAPWHAALLGSEALRAVADRIETDPDGAETAAFVLLAEDQAADGATALAALERQLVGSPATRACLTGSPERGAAEVELTVDGTGFTYRVGGNLPWPVVQCLNQALTEAMTASPAPAAVKTATRTVTLRTP